MLLTCSIYYNLHNDIQYFVSSKCIIFVVPTSIDPNENSRNKFKLKATLTTICSVNL